MQAADVDDPLPTPLAMQSDHRVHLVHDPGKAWLVESRALDMETIVPESLQPLEQVERMIGTGNRASQLRGARLDPTTMRSDHRDHAVAGSRHHVPRLPLALDSRQLFESDMAVGLRGVRRVDAHSPGEPTKERSHGTAGTPSSACAGDATHAGQSEIGSRSELAD